MNFNRVNRAALSQELKFHHSESNEYKLIELQIKELDRNLHSREHDPRKLSKIEQLNILSMPHSYL